ncbi:MAG: fasciclin [Prevotella sp.]|nr:fasciclin [Prevotella sp.]
MAKFKGLSMVCGLFMAAAFAVSCQESLEDSDQYRIPDNVKGNAYQVLEGEGNYSMFLRGIELSGYRPIVDGKSIMTVMAPNNQAFTSFLQEYGYSSVEDMYAQDPTLLKNTIGFHLMYYAYDWNKLVNFRPTDGDGATEEQKQVNAGLYYKHRTRSRDDIEEVSVKLTPTATELTDLKIYHYERFLPVLSNKLFETKGIDAAYNYEYFFPNSQWTGGSNGFNVANASVTDGNAVITDNGYLYHINQVIRPMETIYNELRKNPDYSDFLSLYDSYATYEEADQETNDNLGYTAYIRTHGRLPRISCEWPVNNYRQMAQLESVGYSIFAPTNAAMDRFFTDYWTAESGYSQLSDLDPLILEYFIMQSFAQANELVFPEEIKNEKVQTYYGTPINVEPDQVTDRKMCVNGVLYGMDDMKAPAIFSSVVGPAFKDKNYIDYLYALDGSEYILSLASNKSEFVTLIPSNEQFENNDPAMRLNVTTQGSILEEYSAQDGNFVSMGRGRKQSIVNIHTAQNVNELKTSGLQVVPTNATFNYWYVRDGQITTNALFNEQLRPGYTGSPFVDFHEIQNSGEAWDNGRSYSYDAPMLFAEASGDGLEHLLAVGNDKTYEYYLFSQLLQKSGLVDTKTGLMPSLAAVGLRLIAFVPTNEAISQNIAKIPGCGSLKIASDYTVTGTLSSNNKTLLANYLRQYFISSLMNSFTSYPYPGSDCKGTFLSMSGENLSIIDNGETFSIQKDGANAIPVSTKYFGLPFAFSDGCMQLIDGIIE